MKNVLLLILLFSISLSQDKIIVLSDQYSGLVGGIDSTHLAFREEGKNQISFIKISLLTKVILADGSILVEDGEVLVKTDHALWFQGVKEQFVQAKGDISKVRQSNLKVEDTPILKTQENGSINKVSLGNDQLNDPFKEYTTFQNRTVEFKRQNIGGLFLAISGILGLYAINNEYNGDLLDEKGWKDWADTQKTLSNVQYASMMLGGLLILIPEVTEVDNNSNFMNSENTPVNDTETLEE